MKKFLCVFLIMFSGLQTSFAQDFIVNNFTSDIYIQKEGYVDVVEQYDIEFTAYKHGLFKEIITKFDFKDENGKVEKKEIYITDIKVPGNKFKTSTSRNILSIKIGDANKTVFGKQQYEIRYRITNALIFTKDLTQFYWNVKPSLWEATFKQINFNVHVPEGVNLSAENCFTYSGEGGTSSVSQEFDYSFQKGVYSAKSKNGFNSSYGESVTALVKMPAGIITEPSLNSVYFKKYGWLAIFAIFLFWIIKVIKKHKAGKVISVTSYYAPKGIDPPTAGYLIDDSGDNVDIISLLPKWGNEGLIRMEALPKSGMFSSQNMKIIKLKELPESAPDYERIFFKGLFSESKQMGNLLLKSITDSIKNFKNLQGSFNDNLLDEDIEPRNEVETKDLKDKFYKVMEAAKAALMADSKKYYDQENKKELNKAGCFSFIILIGMVAFFYYVFSPVAAVISGIIGVLALVYLFTLQKKNAKGNEILSELKGFKQFIKLADQKRIETLLKDDPNYFEKTMSYALAFGMLEKWAAQFEALGFKEPEWYSGSSMGAGGFARSFSSGMSAAQSAMVSSPSSSSSSGGGSSGGGAGGGGGGSW